MACQSELGELYLGPPAHRLICCRHRWSGAKSRGIRLLRAGLARPVNCRSCARGRICESASVGVGTMVAHSPLHRSQRALLTHWAPASGDDAKSPQRIGVANAGRWQPSSDVTLHALPGHTRLLATSPQRAKPQPNDTVSEEADSSVVHGHTVVPHVACEHRAQPLSDFRHGIVQTTPKLTLHLGELSLQPLTHHLVDDGKYFVAPLLPANMREAEETEYL